MEPEQRRRAAAAFLQSVGESVLDEPDPRHDLASDVEGDTAGEIGMWFLAVSAMGSLIAAEAVRSWALETGRSVQDCLQQVALGFLSD